MNISRDVLKSQSLGPNFKGLTQPQATTSWADHGCLHNASGWGNQQLSGLPPPHCPLAQAGPAPHPNLACTGWGEAPTHDSGWAAATLGLGYTTPPSCPFPALLLLVQPCSIHSPQPCLDMGMDCSWPTASQRDHAFPPPSPTPPHHRLATLPPSPALFLQSSTAQSSTCSRSWARKRGVSCIFQDIPTLLT